MTKIKPFADSGYTQVHNAVIDLLIPELSGAGVKLLLVIIRQTSGWHKQSDRLSISQLMTKTGLSKKTVINAAMRLAEMKIINREGGDNSNATEYSLNFDFEIDTASGKSTLVEKLHYPSVKSKQPPSVKSKHTKETITKETKQKKRSATIKMVAPPSVKTYVEVFHYNVNRRLWRDIDEVVGDNAEDIARWREILKTWKLRGYNPKNFASLLDVFANGWRSNGWSSNSKDKSRESIVPENIRTLNESRMAEKLARLSMQ